MIYLIVVAHPDDEVLGAGGTIYKLSKQGHTVNLCILSGEANARKGHPGNSNLDYDLTASSHILGISSIIKGDFPNIMFNIVPHLEMVQFIEKAIIETGTEAIITHHPSDINNDHLHTSLACQAAARLFQRRDDITPLKQLLYMEVLSATEWSFNKSMNQFNPNYYYEIGEEGIKKKIEALSQYRGVMRSYPHPRSNEVIEGLAAYRGSQAGMVYAEAFESVFIAIR